VTFVFWPWCYAVDHPFFRAGSYLRRVREMTAQHTAAKRAARVVPVDDEE